MRIRYFYFHIFWLLAASGASLHGQNLVPDGSFEMGGKDWGHFIPEEYGDMGCQFKVEGDQFHEGHVAILFQSVRAARYGLFPADKYLSVKAGDRYRFAAWIRAGDDFRPQPGTPGIVLRATLFDQWGVDYKKGHIFIGLNGVSQPTAVPPMGNRIVPNEWNKIEGIVEIPQDVTQMIVFIFCWKASGKFWVDDVSVTKLP